MPVSLTAVLSRHETLLDERCVTRQKRLRRRLISCRWRWKIKVMVNIYWMKLSIWRIKQITGRVPTASVHPHEIYLILHITRKTDSIIVFFSSYSFINKIFLSFYHPYYLIDFPENNSVDRRLIVLEYLQMFLFCNCNVNLFFSNRCFGATPFSNVGAASKVFPHWSQKTITHLSLFLIVSR